MCFLFHLFYLWCDTGWHQDPISHHGRWGQRIDHNAAPDPGSKLLSSMGQTPVRGVGALHRGSAQRDTHYTNLDTQTWFCGSSTFQERSDTLYNRAHMTIWCWPYACDSLVQEEKTRKITSSEYFSQNISENKNIPVTCPGWRKGTETSFQRSPDPTARFPHMNFSCREQRRQTKQGVKWPFSAYYLFFWL